MRLIDADALGIGKAKPEAFIKPEYAYGWNSAIEAIEAAPTIDAVPVKRGRWKLRKGGCAICDQCGWTQLGAWSYDDWQNFCGQCGADMRGEPRCD